MIVVGQEEAAHSDDVREALRLVDGLDAATYRGTCPCGRPIHLRLGVSHSLRAVVGRLRAWLLPREPRATDEPAKPISRFAFVEVDDK